MGKIFLVVVLVLIPASVFAAEATTPQTKVENFFGMLQKGNIATAYDQLFEGSSIPKDKPQGVALVKQQTQALALYGQILGYELVHEEKLSNLVIRLVYFLNTEKAPLVWEFYFYKPKSDWFLANIIFNDQFQLLDKKN